jgi:hypothetical protein
LIENHGSIDEIKQLRRQAISNQMMVKNTIEINYELANEQLDCEKIKNKVIVIYEV